MSKSILSLSAAAMGLALLIATPAAAGGYNGYARYDDCWGYGSSGWDEYRYNGIAWYGTYGYHYSHDDDFGEGYDKIYEPSDDYDDYVGDYYDDDDD